jgi:predicted nucleic-acid-binding Zn-ribbon protein
MGQLRSAYCEICGYTDAYSLGGSRQNYKIFDPFPVLCRTCRAITTINRVDPAPQTCSRCGESDYTAYGEKTRNSAEFARFQDTYAERRDSEIAELLERLKSDPESILELFGMESDGVEAAERLILDMQDDGPPTGWDAGLHLCPVCGKHALAINKVKMFFD